MRTTPLLARLIAAAALAWPCAAVLAQQPADDLPPPERVRQALLTRPQVQAARAGVDAEAADASRLRRGPEEFVLRLGAQSRRVDQPELGSPANQRFTEGQVGLERTLRSGAKAARDEAIGRAGVELARMELADAGHEASRALLRDWFDWLRERGSVALWRDQLQAQDTLVQHASRRVKAGDAAATELKLQEATRAQVRASLAAAQQREASARAALDVNYPGLSAFAPPAPRLPLAQDLPAGDGQAVLTRLEDGSHEWKVAQLGARLARERAGRVALDTRPDPTVGLHVGSERGGAERIVGVSLALPLAAAARSDAARAAAARADEAELRAQAVRLKVRAQASSDWLAARAAYQAWQSQEDARTRLAQTLAAMERGWALGELAQADVLAARRQYVDSAQLELAARVDARHAAARLQLDLHELWDLDD